MEPGPTVAGPIDGLVDPMTRPLHHRNARETVRRGERIPGEFAGVRERGAALANEFAVGIRLPCLTTAAAAVASAVERTNHPNHYGSLAGRLPSGSTSMSVKSWLPDATTDRGSTARSESSTRVQRPAHLAVAPRRVNMRDAVVGDVVHQVFAVTNRGGVPARFKVYFRKPDPHTKGANHGYVHYSLAGVVSFPSIASQFTVEFHANVVGSFANVLVLQTETQEIEVPFEARVNPQAPHVKRFRKCWPAHKIPLDIGEEELLDFQMMPRLPMCYWDFDEEKMVVATTAKQEAAQELQQQADLAMAAVRRKSTGRRLSSSSKNTRRRSSGPGAHFFNALDPYRSIAELEQQAAQDEEDYAEQLLAALPFPRRVALFRSQDLTGDQFLVPVPQQSKVAPPPPMPRR